ncbi:DUF4160 domain-containing protein [Phyllobacterium zundukense]|uniref:DUF4160 domain-containing protein n=1 Tax=Phyllobacterium zundukense TaxID=1867719 RepID=A0A2N9VVM3_9HYPH|nr:DUF4160 domain-containing protein [Phyllobacterium zundukense]ATU91275.1 hypothetical protein BLM14_06240 [Phyllobacterium zundukense]PIO43541.1 hypothetical protein B5P45_16625 [Phyllobacterium zundukense]
MVIVYREYGLSVAIFLNDHEPPHVHVFGDRHAKIGLAGADGRPYLISHYKMKRNDVRRAIAIVNEHQIFLLAKWRDFHG